MLPPSVLQSVIALHPRLQQFSFMIDLDYDAAQYASVLHQLLHNYHLQRLVISVAMVDPTEFTAHIIPWVMQASAVTCEFVLFGPRRIVDAVKNALAKVEDSDAMERTMDIDLMDHPFNFLYPKELSLVVRRVSTTTAPNAVS